jgi:hypothetical protein
VNGMKRPTKSDLIEAIEEYKATLSKEILNKASQHGLEELADGLEQAMAFFVLAESEN